MRLDTRLQLWYTPLLPVEEQMTVLETTKKRVRELAKIDQIFTDIETSYSDAKKEVIDIVMILIDIAKSRLTNSRWSEKNLIIACNIVYKLLNRDLFENEINSLRLRLGNDNILSSAAYYVQWKINTDIKKRLESILDFELMRIELIGCQSNRSGYNEFSLFCTFVEKTVSENESDLAFIEFSRERIKRIIEIYKKRKKSELLLPIILLWKKGNLNLAEILMYWITEVEELIWNRDSIKNWRNTINVILSLFENFEELKSRVLSPKSFNESLTPEQLFEKILWLKLFEEDWLYVD